MRKFIWSPYHFNSTILSHAMPVILKDFDKFIDSKFYSYTDADGRKILTTEGYLSSLSPYGKPGDLARIKNAADRSQRAVIRIEEVRVVRVKDLGLKGDEITAWDAANKGFLHKDNPWVWVMDYSFLTPPCKATVL